MSERDAHRPQELLAKIFVAEEPEAEAACAVVEAGRGDDEVRSFFNALAFADRELHETDEPAEFEHAFRDAQIMGALDAMLEEETSEEPATANVISLDDRRPSRVAQAGALIAAAAAVLLMIQPIIPEDDGFRARSAVSVTPTNYDQPQIAVYCVEDRPDEGVVFRGASEFDLGVVQCPHDAQLKLAYRNVDSRLKYAGFVGISESGKRLWYGPNPVATAPVRVEASEETRPILETIRLSVNHDVEGVRVQGMFSESPIDHARLKAWADSQHVDGFRENFEPPRDGAATSMTFEVAQANDQPGGLR